MLLPLLKTLHIVGFVAWFAGLFYLVRMFVYHVEAMEKPQPERDILTRQFNLMQWRVYRIICTPAMNLTWVFGIGMLVVHGWEWISVNTWLYIKLVLLFLLSGYHYSCKGIIQKLEKGEKPYSSFQFRLLNEVPTLFLLAIVLLAVYRNSLNALYTMAGMLVFGFLLFGGAKWYRRARLRKEGQA